MRDYGREQRVADFIRRELAVIVQQEMRDPRLGMLSVNDVRVTRDIAWADVYVTAFRAGDAGDAADSRSEVLDVLGGAAGFLRSELAARTSMRTVPRLRFHWDETIERGAHLEKLINTAVADDAARGADDADGDADASTEGQG